MTETFRPSELFALRWSNFDMDGKTLTVSQTAYRGKLRDYGKTKKSIRSVHVPERLANDLWLWRQECPNPAPDGFIFPNSRKRNGATRNGFIRTDNYRARVLKPLGGGTRASQAQLPGAAPQDGDAGSDQRQRQGRAGYPWTQQGRYDRERLHAVDRSQCQADAGGDLLRADGAAAIGGSIVKARSLVRFGTVGVLDGPQVIVPKGRALNSAVECHLHTVEVIGSNPIAPTIFSTAYEPLSDHPLFFQ